MWYQTILLALKEIRRNLMRSTLTILGVVIGVAAVITMVTLGSGATAQVTNDISKLGSNLLQIRPGQAFRGGPGGGARMESQPFEDSDLEAIRNQISSLAAVAPVSSSMIQIIYGNENMITSVTGSTNDYLKAQNWEIDTGREFTHGEISGGKSVCIVGASTKKNLFGAEDPIGMTIRLKKTAFKIIGVFKSKGQAGFGRDQDDFVLIPLKTFQRRISGKRDISSIMVSAVDGASTEKVKKELEGLLRERRPGSKGTQGDDFSVMDMKEIASMLTSTTRVLTGLLGAVAAVSLLVGGIGIMNIMLVSVTERTREIGIRLAIGALENEVLKQFLLEAVVLSSLGGAIGITLGLSAAGLLAMLLGIPFVVSPGIVLIAFMFSAAVGVVFGFVPAKKAAQLDPIEALRHE
ncbi:MAG: ABC transporter permease [Deltaproteobacteria bacterium]|nr:ABC transporter permease [Deltaproteobacteria bacterium]